MMAYMRELKPCPICGAKAFISNDVVDGFWFGWSVGCPRFKLNDGIHNIDDNTPKEERPILFYQPSKKDAINHWNKWVEDKDGEP